jgi:hypothetical protein
MKTLNLFLTVVMISIFLLSGKIFSQQTEHEQDIHKYITYQAWELVKHQHPEVIYSEMSLRMGHWADGSINGTGPWQKGKVITGAYREDEEDVVYKHSFPFTSATHFWDADNGDNATFTPPPFTHNYTNSYQKMLAYWKGNVNNLGWLELGAFFYGMTPFYVRVRYNDLASAYKDHSKFLVTHWYDISTQTWLAENTPQPFIPYILENTTNYSYAEASALLNRVSWEIVGRICHHIEDSGVPAHAHNDAHVVSDYFENIYMPQHFEEYTWEDAAAQGGLIDINNKSYPLRYAIYTTNQIADRFRSDDVCGDLAFPYPSQYVQDNYESILNPVYQSVQNIGVCEGPQSIMQTVAEKSFVYSIRSVAGFLWYVYNQFNIQREYPPVIHGFSRNYSDNAFYLGETFKISCIASGTDLNYEWFYKACDTTSFCNAPVFGLAIKDSNKFYSIKNNNFRNSWSCQFYDSLCRSRETENDYLAPKSLDMFVGVKVSNKYGEVTRYFGNNRAERIYPQGFIRPPSPPISGCPVIFTNTDSGYTPENNTLRTSSFPENTGIDVTDKLIITNKPYIDLSENSINFAITETAGDIDHFDEVSLVSIDHPAEFILAVTENNDIVFIEEDKILSPDYAAINGKDVTGKLKYDLQFSNIVIGNDNDIIDIQYKPGLNFNSRERFIEEFKIKYSDISERVSDSLAIILDPEGDVVIHQTQKRPPGYISVFDTAGIKTTGDMDFTRRVRRSMITLPVPVNNFISNVQIVFKEGFGLSYCAVAELIYPGAIETKHPLIEAVHSDNGEITKYLTNEDNQRSVIDSTSFITLKFKNIDENLPKGWKRDYVMIVKGRTIVLSENNISERTLNDVSESKLSAVSEFALDQNYPNPFNPSTVIKFNIPEDMFVSLKVYDGLGREVRHLVNEFRHAGRHEVTFSAEEGGSDLSSGIYYYKITGSGEGRSFESIRRMVLLR